MRPAKLHPSEIQAIHGKLYVRSPMARPGSMIAIIADWCGHCKNLKKSVALATQRYPFPYFWVDSAEAGPNKLDSIGVQGFPTIFRVAADGSLEKYEGSREATALAQAFRP